MTGDRAELLAGLADNYMKYGWWGGIDLPEGCRRLNAETWPHEEPREIRFTAEWPGITLVCSRPLAGWMAVAPAWVHGGSVSQC